MSHQHLLQVGLLEVLVILFLVGCGDSAPTAVSEIPATTSGPAQAAVTLVPESTTPAPAPPTAASTPEPSPATGGEAAIEPLEVGDSERGREIFENGGEKYTDKPQYHCIRCYSLNGSKGYGPSLQGISERAGDRVPGLSAVEYLRQSILEPDAYIIEGFSENMGRIHRVLLKEEEIDNLVAFMLTQ